MLYMILTHEKLNFVQKYKIELLAFAHQTSKYVGEIELLPLARQKCHSGFITQQDDYVPAVHLLGAFVVFSAGLVYQWVHTYITYRVYRSGVAGHVGVGWVVAQAIISLLSLVFFVGGIYITKYGSTYT